MKTQITRTALTWAVLLLIVALGVYAGFLTEPRLTRPHPHSVPSMVSIVADVLLAVAQIAAIIVVLGTPMWISGSCWVVKMAIDNVQKNNYKMARFYLFSRGWLIFPLPKYAEIIRVLRQLCEDRKSKPENILPEFSQYIVKDDWGNYGLTWDGREMMIKKVNTGRITGEFYESPKKFQLLLRIVVVIALIRLIIALAHFFVHR